MSPPKNYVDIGHTGEAIIWIYRRGRLLTSSTADGKTHNSVWGRDAMRDFRGRYEPDTGRISISPPFNQRNRNTPQWLIDALEEKFGGGGELYQFNPGVRRVK